jgi:hypothetical protein
MVSVSRTRPVDEMAGGRFAPGLFTPIVPEVVGKTRSGRVLTMKSDYSFREPSWSFGRNTEKKSAGKERSKGKRMAKNPNEIKDSKRGKAKQKDGQREKGRKMSIK